MLDKDEQLKLTAIDFAIKAGTGNEFNDFGAMIGNPEKIIAAAEKIYNFMIGKTTND